MVQISQIATGNGGFRSEWDAMTTCKMIIVIGGFFWAIFTISFAFYNYCAIEKPPPAVSFEESLCAEEEALMATKSQRSLREASKNMSSRK